MRSAQCSLAVVLLAGQLFAQVDSPIPAPVPADPPAVTGKTEVKIGQPSYGVWNGNSTTVTIEVTHEIASNTHSWVAEARSAVHITGPIQSPITVFGGTFVGGAAPTPGGGSKKIVYTFTVQDGWDDKFSATMRYKKDANDPGTDLPETTATIRAKK